ncbi:MAG TPA: prephenate dehydrogenase/arogenate dehydrogenase family protein, partial [Fimbriimonadaceae bacterium]|nr:prephenate dehydrogenase/arogenate dehydrogenase family protein [Fimbriimonadaceae bacterium]
VFLAVPPDAVVEAYSQVPASVPVVTDTASVKGTVMSRIGDDRFVGGHPMAGKESGGLGAAEASLFLGAYWLLCPGGPSAVETLSSVVRSIGAKPLIMSAEEHDRHVALLSHLPHLLALHLLDLSGALPFPEVAAGSWRDLTRVAAADPALWIQILRANAPAVADAAETLGRRLQQDAGRLRAGDTGGLERLFEARDRRGGS